MGETPTSYINLRWQGDNLMKISEAFPSASGYLDKELVAKKDFPKVVTISRVETKLVGKKQNMKINVYFKEIVARMRLNKKNAFSIAEILGSEDTDDWADGELSIYIDKDVTRGTDVVGGIRIKKPEA